MKATQAEDNSPSKIGNYVFGRNLGKGTFGKVKLATHTISGEKVAIKILEKDKIKDKKDVERITREIKILKKVRHPYVIQLYEIIETETELYLITEYANGGELFDYIVSHKKLNEKIACKFYQELINGLEYIHKSGICHRDLKPENLLLDFDKTLKLVDFGLSNMYEPSETLKTACGSPCYAAPEMIAGKKYHGLLSDIWSSGVVLFAMVAGHLPFEDPKTSNLYKKILSADYKMPQQASPQFKDFLTKILCTNPETRFNITQIRSHTWFQINKEKRQVGLFPLQEKIPIHQWIFQQTIDLVQCEEDYALKCIESNRHNSVTATYNLLFKKEARSKNLDLTALNKSIDANRHSIDINSGPAPPQDPLNQTMPINFNPSLHKDEGPEAKSKFKQSIQNDLQKLRQRIDNEVSTARRTSINQTNQPTTKAANQVQTSQRMTTGKEQSVSPDRYQFVQSLQQQFSHTSQASSSQKPPSKPESTTTHTTAEQTVASGEGVQQRRQINVVGEPVPGTMNQNAKINLPLRYQKNYGVQLSDKFSAQIRPDMTGSNFYKQTPFSVPSSNQASGIPKLKVDVSPRVPVQPKRSYQGTQNQSWTGKKGRTSSMESSNQRRNMNEVYMTTSNGQRLQSAIDNSVQLKSLTGARGSSYQSPADARLGTSHVGKVPRFNHPAHSRYNTIQINDTSVTQQENNNWHLNITELYRQYTRKANHNMNRTGINFVPARGHLNQSTAAARATSMLEAGNQRGITMNTTFGGRHSSTNGGSGYSTRIQSQARNRGGS